MFRFDQLIRRDTIIRDVKQRHPETLPVFEEFNFRPTCDDCTIETVARKNGLNVLDVVEALEGPLTASVCDSERESGCVKSGSCAAAPVWAQATNALRDVFASTTLAALAGTQDTFDRADSSDD